MALMVWQIVQPKLIEEEIFNPAFVAYRKRTMSVQGSVQSSRDDCGPTVPREQRVHRYKTILNLINNRCTP